MEVGPIGELIKFDFQKSKDKVRLALVSEGKNLKTLRQNPFAQRELRLRGKYRVLFNVVTAESLVHVLAVGEKSGERLLVRGKEFTAHHEDSSIEQSEG